MQTRACLGTGGCELALAKSIKMPLGAGRVFGPETPLLLIHFKVAMTKHSDYPPFPSGCPIISKTHHLRAGVKWRISQAKEQCILSHFKVVPMKTEVRLPTVKVIGHNKQWWGVIGLMTGKNRCTTGKRRRGRTASI